MSAVAISDPVLSMDLGNDNAAELLMNDATITIQFSFDLFLSIHIDVNFYFTAAREKDLFRFGRRFDKFIIIFKRCYN